MNKLFDDRVIRVIMCPKCSGALIGQGESLVCKECSAKYPIVDGIVIFLDEKLDPVSQETREYYDSFPMDTGVEKFGKSYYERHPVYKEVVRDLKESKDKVVVDVGCGVGRLVSLLQGKGFQCLGVDQSFTALRTSRKLYGTRHLLNGTNMRLPLVDSSADILVSNGVIFLTPSPRQAFNELVRVLKQSGELHLCIYDRRHVYYLCYKIVGGIFRFLNGSIIGRLILKLVFFPLFYLLFYLTQIFFFRSLKFVPLKKCWNTFGDTFLTPHCRFYTTEEMKKWFEEEGMTINCISRIFTGTMLYYKAVKNQR